MAEKDTNLPSAGLSDFVEDLKRLCQAVDNASNPQTQEQMSVEEAEAPVNEDMGDITESPLHNGRMNFYLDDDHPAIPALGRLHAALKRVLDKTGEITDDDVQELEKLVFRACKILTPDHPMFKAPDAAEGSNMDVTQLPDPLMTFRSNVQLFSQETFGDAGLGEGADDSDNEDDNEEEEDMEDTDVDTVGDGDQEMEDTEA